MGRHRIGELPETVSERVVFGAAGKPRVRQRQPGQRQGIVGRRATVNTHAQVVGLHAGGQRHVAPDRCLQWMLGIDVIVQTQALLDAIGQKTGVFSAAVVMAFVKHRTFGRFLAQGFENTGHVTAAAQCLVGEAGFVEHGLGLGHMVCFAAMAGAQHRDLFWPEAELPGPARLHEWQGLQRFECRARKAEPVRIAGLGQQLPLAVNDGDSAEMLAFQRAGAGEFDQRYEIGHAPIVTVCASGVVRTNGQWGSAPNGYACTIDASVPKCIFDQRRLPCLACCPM